MSADEEVEREAGGDPDDAPDHGLRGRLSSAGEDALGELAQNLFENPVFNQALATALGAGERAVQAQRSALTALNIPAASDIERLERRLRSLSDRLELLEDRLDEIGDEVTALTRRLDASPPGGSGQARLGASDPRDAS